MLLKGAPDKCQEATPLKIGRWLVTSRLTKWSPFCRRHFQVIHCTLVPSDPIVNQSASDKPYMNQWWHSWLMHICMHRPQWVKIIFLISYITEQQCHSHIHQFSVIWCKFFKRFSITQTDFDHILARGFPRWSVFGMYIHHDVEMCQSYTKQITKRNAMWHHDVLTFTYYLKWLWHLHQCRNFFFQFRLARHFNIYWQQIVSLESEYLYCPCCWCSFQYKQHLSERTVFKCKNNFR